MKRTAKAWIATTGMLMITACSYSGNGRLSVTSLPTVLAQGSRPVPFRIAEANGQLALGNVALALESYRKALRDDPRSVDALAGMATCYDAFGRFELSQRNYQAALAVEPANTLLLGRYAASLMAQGRNSEATAIRNEIASRDQSSVGAAVSVALSITHIPEPESMAPGRISPVAAIAPATAGLTGPRLSRLSFGEVALITRDLPVQRVEKSAPSIMRTAKGSGSSPILLLNAARSEGLARRTGAYLAVRGYHDVRVGTAPRVLARSLIIYPAMQRERAVAIGRSLAVPTTLLLGKRLTVVLGRDAADHRTLGG